MNERNLPGDPSYQDRIAQMIRVNQAGEYGAKRIYAGQLAVLKNTKAAQVIAHMAAQEEVHLAAFNRMMCERRVRPTLLTPIWHVGGYALGAITALMGEKAAMACTVAVESVINDHYAEQEKKLENDEPELKQMVAQFRAEEMEHHDTALAHGAEQTPAYGVLSEFVKWSTKTAIWISKRI